MDERDLAALLPAKLLDPIRERLARPLAAADFSQFVEQTRRRVVVGRRASLYELHDLTPHLILPPRECAQMVLAGEFSGAAALLCLSLGALTGRTLPVCTAPSGLREQVRRGPAGAVPGLDRRSRSPAGGQQLGTHPHPVPLGHPQKRKVLALRR